MSCICCKNETNFRNSIKTQDGRICKTCAAHIPSLLIKHANYLSQDVLKNVTIRTAENKAIFQATAAFGQLFIDGQHGLFAITKDLNKAGKPIEGNNIFSIRYLDDIGIFCKSPRVDHEQVFVDIELRCSLQDPDLQFSTIIKRNVKCVSKRVDNEHITWDEPSHLAMFRTIFNQMLSENASRVKQMLFGKTIYEFEVEKACAVFMLDVNFTRDELDKAKQILLKAYQSEENENERECDLIEKAYAFLCSHLSRKTFEKGT